MKIFSLNCQKDHNPALAPFLAETLASQAYDFLLLQEMTPTMCARHAGQGGYSALRAFSPEIGKESHVCIFYRPEFTLHDQELISFDSFCPIVWPMGKGRAEFGFLAGAFTINGRRVVMGSLHLHAGPFPRTRHSELALVQERLAAFAQGSDVLFAGDCNFGVWGELYFADRLLSASYARASQGLPPTLNSLYTEFSPNPVSATAVVLRTCGMALQFKADQVFASRSLAESSAIECRVLPDRVSDHSPIEVSTSAKSAR